MLELHKLRFLVLVVSILIIYKIIRAYGRRRLQKKWNTSSVQEEKSFMEGILNLFTTFEARRSGRGPEYSKEKLKNSNTISYFLFGKRSFETRDADNIKEVLVHQSENFGIGRRQQILYPIVGNGIFASEGPHWSFSRSILKPQFKRAQIMNVQFLESHVQNFFKHIRSEENKPFDIQRLFYKFTLDASTEFLFGESLGTLCKDARSEFTGESQEQEFEAAFNLSLRYMTNRLSLQRFYFLVDSKEFRKANEKVKEYAKFYVNKILNLDSEELEVNSQGQYMFLKELSKEHRNRNFLEDEALSLMLAGRSTTASFLSFAIFELARSQRIWEKLKEEVDNTFGRGDNTNLEAISFESMKRCKYLQWIMNETLRLYPPVPFNMRLAKKHTKLPKGGGSSQEDPILLEKDEPIFLSIYGCHHCKEYYGDDADSFIPERWGHLQYIGRKFVPFGAGPRICLGQQFALTEASYTIIRIAQTFLHLVSRSEDYPPKLNSSVTMSLMDGCLVSLY